MKVLFTSIFALFLATSAWATGEMPNPANCTESDLGASEGPLNIDLVWEPNTINTTWYSEGVQIQNAPQSCSYSNTMTLPTAPSRPGYAFAGWTLKPPCLIPSTLASTNGNAYASKRLSDGEEVTSGGATASTYGLTESGQWGVSWTNGDKVVGEAICSQTSGTANVSGTPDVSGTGTTRYCWCRTTGYQANGENKCNLVSSSWVLYKDYLGDMVCSRLSGPNTCMLWVFDAGACAYDCAQSCASYVSGQSVFRTAVFGTNVTSGDNGGGGQSNDFSLASLDASIDGTAHGWLNNAQSGQNASVYGLEDANTWGVSFSYGKVIGSAFCSSATGDNHSWDWGTPSSDWTGTNTAVTASAGANCWCKGTGFIASGSSTTQNTTSSAWTFHSNYGDTSTCQSFCAGDCGNYIEGSSNLRSALFNN